MKEGELCKSLSRQIRISFQFFLNNPSEIQNQRINFNKYLFLFIYSMVSDFVISFDFFLRPVHRTAQEHNIVWKMLRTIPELNSNLSKEHLKIVSRNLVSQTWIKGSTGNSLMWRGIWQDKIHDTPLTSRYNVLNV